MTAPPPLCFVIMPFGRKETLAGRVCDFDAVYEQLFRPAIEAAGLEALRGDEEQLGGLIHQPLFERLALCRYALADLSAANPNVYYELGVRHGLRPFSTICAYDGALRQLPFDVRPTRSAPYTLDADGRPAAPEQDGARITELLRAAQAGRTDSPLFQLLDGLQPPELSRLKTDVFEERVHLALGLKRELAEARAAGLETLRAFRQRLGDLADDEFGLLVELLLAFRAASAWQDMIDLVEAMDPVLARTALVREQLALALNRAGRGDEAELVLETLLDERGDNSETCGLLGRVRKDRWKASLGAAGPGPASEGLRRRALETYLRGFRADWRDAYPGINALTLMACGPTPDPRLDELLPVVRYAVTRRVEDGQPDYWDRATLLELAVLARDQGAADEALTDALGLVRAGWEPTTTADNLDLLRRCRGAHGQHDAWLDGIIDDLRAEAARQDG